MEKLKLFFPLSEDDYPNCLTICAHAAREIQRKMKPGADENDERLIEAAAASAYCRLTLKNEMENGEVSSFSAGDVTVTKNQNIALKLAEAVRDEALANAHELLTDDGFIFEKVDG